MWLPTRGLLAPRWVFTYKNGLSSGHNGCYGRVSAACSELGFVRLSDSRKRLPSKHQGALGCQASLCTGVEQGMMWCYGGVGTRLA